MSKTTKTYATTTTIDQKLAEFIGTMEALRATNRKAHRAMMGLMRALYETRAPQPRSRRDRADHAHIVAKVRPIDRRRAAMAPEQFVAHVLGRAVAA